MENKNNKAKTIKIYDSLLKNILFYKLKIYL